MNKTTEALKMAEEALDELRYANDTLIAKTKYYKALAAIREELAEQEKQEPVDLGRLFDGGIIDCICPEGVFKLYTAPVSVEAAVLAEREACAKVCDCEGNTEANMNKTWRNGCFDCAEAIRARS